LAALGAVQRFLRWPGGHLVRGVPALANITAPRKQS